jgi:hypothetical protein
MPKNSKKRSAERAAEQSVPKKPRTNRPKDAVKSKAGKASAAARKAKRAKGDPVARQCSARRTNGEPCRNSAIRGGSVCARHGGSAPQVRAKANRRLIEMVLPAMRELHRILNDPTTEDSDKLKAINMVLNRTGYSERQQIDLGLREPTAWDRLVTDGAAFSIRRGGDLAEELAAGAEHQQLPNPNDDSMGGVDDEALDALLDQRARWREREAQTRLDHSGHEVVPGDIGRTPDEHPEPGPSYEERLIERIEDPRRGRRP